MPESADSEIEHLRAENKRLRQERDFARREHQNAGPLQESESSVRLRLVAEELSRDIKVRFLDSLKIALWVGSLLLGIATAGGFWKLSDIVTARVDQKLREKEQDVAQIRQQIIKAAVDFERHAQKSLEDIERLRAQVSKESDQATGEIRQARARVSSVEISTPGGRVTGFTSAPEGSGTWFGSVSGGVVAVAGSQAGGFGFEDTKNVSGAFSLRFQRALQDPSADANEDGRLSLGEAALFAKAALRRDGFDQSPTVVGAANDVALFATDRVRSEPKMYKRVFAVVVGISKYGQPELVLRGALNDARGFENLLERKDTGLFAASSVQLLADEQATTKGIRSAISALRAKATKDDLVVFYYSGYVQSVGKDKDVQKVLYPIDGDLMKGRYLRVNEVVKNISAVGAKHALVVVDG